MRSVKPVVLFILIFLLASCGNNDNENRFSTVVEATTVQVPALTGGKLLTLLVDTGTPVSKGQLIAQIDTTDLNLEKLKIQAQVLELAAQRLQIQADLKAKNEDFEHIREKYNRIAELARQQAVNQQSADDLENLFKKSRAALEASRARLQAIGAKEKQLEAALRLLNKKISDARIVAPRSGIVSAKYYEPGEALPAFSPLVEIIDLSSVWVKIYVPEQMLPHIQIGQEVQVNVDGLEEQLTGKVAWLSPKAEFTPKTILTPESRTSLVYAVRVNIDNPDQILKKGMPVEVVVNGNGER